jgi:hypothetical protein
VVGTVVIVVKRNSQVDVEDLISSSSPQKGCVMGRDPAVRSGPVFRHFAKTEDQTKRSGPVRSWDTAETGPRKDQDRGLVPVFERSWSDRTENGGQIS